MRRFASLVLLLAAMGLGGCIVTPAEPEAASEKSLVCDGAVTAWTAPNGIEVSGRFGTVDGVHCFVGEAVNPGAPTTITDPDGCGSWTMKLQDASKRPVTVRPGYSCTMALVPHDLATNERVPYATEWNATVYDEGQGTYSPAPAGPYSWQVTFRPPEARKTFGTMVEIE